MTHAPCVVYTRAQKQANQNEDDGDDFFFIVFIQRFHFIASSLHGRKTPLRQHPLSGRVTPLRLPDKSFVLTRFGAPLERRHYLSSCSEQGLDPFVSEVKVRPHTTKQSSNRLRNITRRSCNLMSSSVNHLSSARKKQFTILPFFFFEIITFLIQKPFFM